MAKPLWEVWLVEGLEGDRWALISKVHHCMVDGVAGNDLLQTIFDAAPAAAAPAQRDWQPAPGPSTVAVLTDSLQQTVVHPVRQLATLPTLGWVAQLPGALLRTGGSALGTLPGLARQLRVPVATSLNGSIGPHRRWSWARTDLDAVKRVRAGLGGTVNDVVLAAITRGFRDLLAGRGELADRVTVRSMVPVSVRRETEHG